MTEIEKIQQYIERTNMKRKTQDKYAMNMKEIFELVHKAQGSCFPSDAICLAFDYGRAKGYRAAKEEARA